MAVGVRALQRDCSESTASESGVVYGTVRSVRGTSLWVCSWRNYKHNTRRRTLLSRDLAEAFLMQVGREQ